MGVVLGRAGPCGTARGPFADDRMARGTAHGRSARSSGGFSAGAGRGRGGALLGHKVSLGPADISYSMGWRGFIEEGSMRCQRCTGEQFVKAGFDRAKRQIHCCTTCQHRQTVRSTSAFCGYRFPDDIIALAVR